MPTLARYLRAEGRHEGCRGLRLTHISHVHKHRGTLRRMLSGLSEQRSSWTRAVTLVRRLLVIAYVCLVVFALHVHAP